MYGIELYMDSTAAISLATKDQVSERNKHVEIKVHHVRDLIRAGVIKLQHISTDHQPADVLKKILPRAKIEHLTHLIGMRPMMLQGRRDRQRK